MGGTYFSSFFPNGFDANWWIDFISRIVGSSNFWVAFVLEKTIIIGLPLFNNIPSPHPADCTYLWPRTSETHQGDYSCDLAYRYIKQKLRSTER